MTRKLLVLVVAVVCGILIPAAAVRAQGLNVVSVQPAANSGSSSVYASIVVTFDKPVLTSSVIPLQSFWAFGRWSGTVQGTFSFSNGDHTVTLKPSQPFSAGEEVMVILSNAITATDVSTLRAGGYSFQFRTRAAPATMTFQQVDLLSTRTNPGVLVRSYGAVGTDLNNDGFPDLTVVNEIAEDLRVFLNQGTGDATYAGSFLTPTFGVEHGASANEPSDFDRDGNADLCTANIDDDSVTILLGNGDGTFAPGQRVAVGDTPLGIVVLDVDGDGDTDIANTNMFSDKLTILLNDGNGVFGAAAFVEGGDTQERALAAGDMNGDGLLDLVVGFQSGQSVVVNLNNGNGTFTPGTPVDLEGRAWMLALGDLDGDGHLDVSSANGLDDEGAILLGDGNGNLGAADVYSLDTRPIATDLGDLDGDGDLDWVTSSFFGDFVVYSNDGSGHFTEVDSFSPTDAGSCATLVDMDNDGDLDMALVDEVADEMLLLRNVGTPAQAMPMLPLAGLAAFAALLAGAAVVARR